MYSKGCVVKIKVLRFSQIWSLVLETRAKGVARELPLSERLKKWGHKDG